MLTFPLGIRIAAISVATITLAVILLGNERSAGFGVVREGASVDAPVQDADLAQRLARLRAMLGIEPIQEAAWSVFVDRMLDLDQVSRRFEAKAREQGIGATDERTRHALLFAVALSDMDSALSSPQSAALQREARALGSTFICAEVRQQGA